MGDKITPHHAPRWYLLSCKTFAGAECKQGANLLSAAGAAGWGEG